MPLRRIKDVLFAKPRLDTRGAFKQLMLLDNPGHRAWVRAELNPLLDLGDRLHTWYRGGEIGETIRPGGSPGMRMTDWIS